MKSSELIINNDGSIYHLHLRPEHVAGKVILVGDQARVAQISQYFDKVEFQIQNREFVTHTGIYRGTRMTVISTGIGTDNIDIVMNELDAVVNIDLIKRTPKVERKSLEIVRIGTSGALQKDIHVGSFVIAEYGVGFDGLVYYYHFDFDEDERKLSDQINEQLDLDPRLSRPYVVKGSKKLIGRLGMGMYKGLTATATGFYGPQGRNLFLEAKDQTIKEKMMGFAYAGKRITNFEMETSAIYALGKMMGHDCSTCCAIVANRLIGEYCNDYKSIVDELIKTVLERL